MDNGDLKDRISVRKDCADLNKQADSPKSSRATGESSRDPALLSGRLLVDDDSDFRRVVAHGWRASVIGVNFVALRLTPFGSCRGIPTSWNEGSTSGPWRGSVLVEAVDAGRTLGGITEGRAMSSRSFSWTLGVLDGWKNHWQCLGGFLEACSDN